MSNEESKQVAKLLDPNTDLFELERILKWIGEYLEQGYILNLRPASDTIEALQKFSNSSSASIKLKKRALALSKKYKPRR